MTDVLDVVQTWASAQDLQVEAASASSVTVVLPGTQRLRIPVAFTATPQALVIECFAMRATDEDPQALYEYLLRRNTRTFGVAYAIDSNRDVFIVGRLPVDAVTLENVDQCMGNLMSMADGDFNTLLELAYPDAIAREWRWRLARGESTENLEAFTHLRPHDA